jgi:hypothetical protein
MESGGGDRSISNFVVAIPNRSGVLTRRAASRPTGLPATGQLRSIVKPLSVDANAVL